MDTGTTISGTVITYAYDPLGQVQQAVRGTNGATTSYAYDLAGHITRTVDADLGTWLYTYNAAGNLTGRVDGRGCTTTYGYNGQGRQTSKTYSGSTGVPNAQLSLVKRQVCGGTTSDTTLSTLNSAGNGKFQLEYPYPACNSGCSCTVHLSVGAQ